MSSSRSSTNLNEDRPISKNRTVFNHQHSDRIISAAFVSLRTSPQSVRVNEVSDSTAEVCAPLVGKAKVEARIDSSVDDFIDRFTKRFPFTRHRYAVSDDRRRHRHTRLVAKNRRCGT